PGTASSAAESNPAALDSAIAMDSWRAINRSAICDVTGSSCSNDMLSRYSRRGGATELERLERALGSGHQPAEAHIQQALDVARVHVRVAAHHARFLADIQNFLNSGGNGRVLVLTWKSEVL